jgi:CHRD domain
MEDRMTRTRWLAVGAGAAALGALASGVATANGATKVIAPLNAAQEVPKPSGVSAGASGQFRATISEGRAPRLTWRLNFRGLTGPAVQAHVHIGRPGVAGPVAVTLCGPCDTSTRGSAPISAAVRRALLDGTAYVNVHTARNGAGEIRGQVGLVVAANLTVGQEVPRPSGAQGASGAFTGRLVGRGLSWALTFRGLTGPAVQAHIHLGRRGVAGPVAVTLCGPCRSGRRGTATLTAAQLRALKAGRTYVNVHTPRNGAGEIRGQVRAG